MGQKMVHTENEVNCKTWKQNKMQKEQVRYKEVLCEPDRAKSGTREYRERVTWTQNKTQKEHISYMYHHHHHQQFLCY